MLLPLCCALFLQLVSDDLNHIVALAEQTNRKSVESLPAATGEGMFSTRHVRLAEGKLKTLVHEHGTFSMAFAKRKSFIKFNFDDSSVNSIDPGTTARVCVVDDESIAYTEFNPRIGHGARGVIESDAERFGTPPHMLNSAWSFLDQSLTEAKKTPSITPKLENDKHLYKVIIEYANDAMVEFTIDSTKEHHISSVGLKNENVEMRISKDWAKTQDGIWYVKRLVVEKTPTREGSTTTSWEFHYKKFHTNADVPADLFTLGALGLPRGARIIDRRVQPNVSIHVAESGHIPRIEFKVDELPEAKPKPPRPLVPPEILSP